MQRKQPKLYFRGTSRPEVFPIREIGGLGDEQNEHKLQTPTFNTLTSSYRGSPDGASRNGALYELTKNASQGYRVYDPKGIATTIASQAGGVGAKTGLYEMENLKIRRLTPTECARLQGFPDDWHKIEGISDTQAYKCYGNAVTVNVIREIAKRLIHS